MTVCEPGFEKALPAADLSVLLIQLIVTAGFAAYLSGAFADVQPCSIYGKIIKIYTTFQLC